MTEPCKPCEESRRTSNEGSAQMPLRAPESPCVSLGPISIIHTIGSEESVWQRLGAALPDYVASWSDGALRYKKGPGDTLPPSPPEGFRVVPDDPWSFVPIWPSCHHRVYTVSLAEPPSADIMILPECMHHETDQRVSLEVCEECPHRQPI